MMLRKAVTLLELLTVVLIIGILVALTLPRYSTMRERAMDKEAVANLKLIQAAEKIYRMEENCYYPTGDDADGGEINSFLRLQLPTSGNWDYSIPDTGGGSDFAAEADRRNPPGNWDREYSIDKDDDEACCCPRTSVCPSSDWCSSCP